MESLHPLAIHVPIGVVLLWPLIDAAGLILKRADISLTALALLILAIPAALFATMTGQAAYDAAIAAGASPDVLNSHADLADLVPWLLLVAAVVRIVGPKRAGAKGHWLAIVCGLAIAALVVNVGYSGGQLVYVHGVGVPAK